jgi:hypothetical protein
VNIESLLCRVFRHEEINGGERCPTYLHRWTIFQPRRPRRIWRGVGVYLHKFVGDDWSSDLHDHPKRFISIGLRGAYREATPPAEGSQDVGELLTGVSWRTYTAPWIRTFPAEHKHRLELLEDRRPCWTLVIVLRSVRDWGFWTRKGWIFWRDYVRSEDADRAKTC